MTPPTAPSVLLSLAALFVVALLAACGVSDDGVTPAAAADGNGTASIAGVLELEEDTDPLGIIVFAEGTSHMALTDSRGHFVLGGLPAGSYRLRATRTDLETTMIADVRVTSADIAAEQPFLELEPAQVASRGASDDPARRATARLGALTGMVQTSPGGNEGGVTVTLRGTRYRTVTYDDGFYELVNVEPGDYELVVARSGFPSRTHDVSISPGQETELDPILLEGDGPPDARANGPGATRTIFGQVEVLTADGTIPSDYSFVRVNLEGTSHAAIPDTDGRFQFTGLPARTYVVSASANNYLLERRYEVNLADLGAAEVDLLLVEDTTSTTREGSIIGRVLLDEAPDGAHAGINVAIAGSNMMAFTDGTGRFEFLNVEPGTYDLIASMNGYHNGTIRNVRAEPDTETDAGELTLERDVLIPRVVYTSPADGSRDVVVDNPTSFTIQFNTNMDIGSVRSAVSVSPEVDFRLVTEGTPGRGAQDVFRIDLAGVSGSQRGALRFGTRYTITIGREASSLEGESMRSDHSINFTTGHARIIATLPEDGAANARVFYDQPIRVFFNAPLDPESVRREDISFRPELNGSPNVYLRRDPETGWSVLFISGFAEPDTNYTVNIRRGMRTVTRDRIRNIPYSFSFQTREWREFEDEFGLRNDGREALQRERERR